MPPKSPVTYAFQPAPLDPSLGSIKKISFGLLSFTVRSNSFGDTLHSPRLPTPPPTEWKEFVSRLLIYTLLVFVQYTLSLLNFSFFVLRSTFLGISKTDPYHSCPLPSMSDCDSCVRADGVLVWVQTVWINRLLRFSSPVLYYWQ
jgi:hypothetical protein